MEANLILGLLAMPACAILVTGWAAYLHRRDQSQDRRKRETWSGPKRDGG